MAKPADVTLKDLLEQSPGDWVVLTGHAESDATVIDSDIATVSGATDKVVLVRGSPDWLLDLNFVSGHDAARLPKRLHKYNTLLDDRHEMPVRSVAVILRPEADSPQLTGTWERRFAGQ